MARIRSIKPQAFTSESLADVTVHARWTFAGLWTYVDDEGRGKADPRLIKGQIWPLDDDVTSKDVASYIDELEAGGMVCRYEVDGRTYLHVVRWHEHQSINKSTRSKLPCCPSHSPNDPVPDPYEGCPPDLREPYGSPTGEVEDAYAGEQGTGSKEQGRETDTPGRAATAQADADEDVLIQATAVKAPTFDDFYEAYPRHEGRAKAKEAWDRLVKAKVSPQVILEGAQRFAADPNLPEKRVIPHPTTWLNGRRWEDDPLPPLLDRKRDQRDSPVREDGSIDADAVLGPEKWSLPSSPPGIEPGSQGYAAWARRAWDEHKAEREAKAREVLARRSA